MTLLASDLDRPHIDDEPPPGPSFRRSRALRPQSTTEPNCGDPYFPASEELQIAERARQCLDLNEAITAYLSLHPACPEMALSGRELRYEVELFDLEDGDDLDDNEDPPLAVNASWSTPGSSVRIAEYYRRYASGYSIFHPGDMVADDFDGPAMTLRRARNGRVCLVELE